MFWERLYNLCLENNYKPNTVAKEIGLSSATTTKWKNGAIPNGEALIKIADFLGCSVDYLLGRTDAPEKTTAPIQLDEGGSNVMLLAGRNGQHIKIQLTDEQYDMLYKMFCSFPDADDPNL